MIEDRLPASTPDPWSLNEYEGILADTAHRLWLFIRPHAQIEHGYFAILSRLIHLSPDDLRRLRAIHFLIRPELRSLLLDDVPLILRKLASTSMATVNVTNEDVRGAIDWTRTIGERASGENYSMSLYVVRRAWRNYDLAPNQVLKALLQATRVLAGEILQGRFGAEVPVPPLTVQTWLAEVAQIQHLCDTYLKNSHIRAISPPAAITGAMLQATRAARNPAYRAVESLFRHYQELVEGPGLQPVEQVLREQVLRPLDPDVLYELAILFDTLDALEAYGWHPVQLHLIGSSGKSSPLLSTRHAQAGRLDIYYQQIPPDWRTLSAYNGIFEKYSVGTATRRPDIVLCWHLPGGSRRSMIIEVKRSSNVHYLVESVYKLLGYLKDFARAFGAADPHPQLPAAILAAWDNVLPLLGIDTNSLLRDEVLLSTYRNYTLHLHAILDRLLQHIKA